ncbi:MAG TPA: cyclophilin-like fold protein [Burkholderiales bacterium]|nr:cyclophilin-like fold protein [Burkholderiales bacterium]
MARIRIAWKGGEVTANLRDSPTARRLLEALPCEARASTWGEEVYFELPVEASLEPDARQVVEPGTVCYWVQGRSLALPFGPTPISRGAECRLVTRCNLLGRIEGDPRALGTVRDGTPIRVEALAERA